VVKWVSLVRSRNSFLVSSSGALSSRAGYALVWGDATPRNLHGCPLRTLKNCGAFEVQLRKVAFARFTRCRVAPTCRRLQKAGNEQSKPGTCVHPLRCASPTSGLSFQGTQPPAEKRTYELALEAHPPARYTASRCTQEPLVFSLTRLGFLNHDWPDYFAL